MFSKSGTRLKAEYWKVDERSYFKKSHGNGRRFSAATPSPAPAFFLQTAYDGLLSEPQHRIARTMLTPKRTTFYSDYNCPFCFAQHERIARLHLDGQIDLKPIQHQIALPIPRILLSPRQRTMVEEELQRLAARAPEVAVGIPSGLPSSGPASLAYASLQRRNPTAAPRFARAVFQALWLHDRDISDLNVLASITRACGAEPLPATAEDRLDVATWQRTWQEARFEGRIPSLLSEHGAVLLGLNDDRRLQAFVTSGHISASSDDACKT